MKKNIKADIPINKLFEEKLFDHQFHQSQNLLLTEEAFCISASAEDWVLKERYTKENTSSSLHIQWAIDQGATHLGGYRIRVHAKGWGLPFFSRLYFMLIHMDETLNPSSLLKSWRKPPGLKCVWIQQVEDFIWRMFQMFIIAYSKNMC